jgi:PhoD-like phosphatase
MSEYKIALGPLLGVESDTTYSVCILLKGPFEDDDPILQVNGSNYSPQQIGTNHTYIEVGISIPYRFYRFEFTYTNETNADVSLSYGLRQGNEDLKNRHHQSSWSFNVCPQNAVPKVAFTSCAGVHKEDPKDIDPKFYLGFEKMVKEQPHYLLLTGDQIYADCITKKPNGFKEFFYGNDPMNQQVSNNVDDFYLNLYIDSWAFNIHYSTALATIPNIMTWDDHDIIDGYGSHIEVIQERYNYLFPYAKKYFDLFQCRAKYSEVYFLKLRNCLFIIPDTRSFRTEKVILKKEQYDVLKNYLSSQSAMTHHLSHVSFILPVPLAHMDFTTLVEKLWRGITKLIKTKKLVSLHNDDVVDHWDHSEHEAEQRQMLDLIFQYVAHLNPKYLTIISGDVHCSGGATIEKAVNNKPSVFANQFIASPIINNSPGIARLFIYATSFNTKTIGPYTCKLKNFGTYNRKNLYKRSFLVIKSTSRLLPDGNQSKPYLNSELFYENGDTWAVREGENIYKNVKLYK